MPIYDRLELVERDVGPSLVAREPVTPVFVARAESSSEAAALHGKKALTPIIAGCISGSIIAVAWSVAIVYALVKRHRRKKRYRKAGRPDLAHEQPRPDAFIVPPDPAVVTGERNPGERIYVGRNKKKGAKELAKLKEQEKLMDDGKTTEDSIDRTVDEKHTPTSKHGDDVRHALADIPEDGQMNMPSPSRRPTNTSSSMASCIAIDDAAIHAKKKKKHDKEKAHVKEADFGFDEHPDENHEEDNTSHSRHGHDSNSRWPW